jgi:hypothetical protein
LSSQKGALNGPETLPEDGRIIVLPAAPLRCFASARILGDVRGHASIEDRTAVVVRIKTVTVATINVSQRTGPGGGRVALKCDYGKHVTAASNFRYR